MSEQTLKSKLFKLALEGDSERQAVAFIREHFSAKECKLYVPDAEPNRIGISTIGKTCRCGGAPEEHVNVEKLPVGNVDWTGAITDVPTDSFGRLHFRPSDFVSAESVKYLRLSDSSDPAASVEFMCKQWRLIEEDDLIDNPQLILSVVGGGRLFNLPDGIKKKLFRRELMRAVDTTNGWLITSGLDIGVTAAVGDAMRECQTFVWHESIKKFKNKITCIGIAPWGGVYRAQNLVNTNPERLAEVTYPVIQNVTSRFRNSRRLPLNARHTHFLLVDDGHRGRERGTASYRARLEKQFSKSVDDGGLGVPVVQILIEGAANALELVAESVVQGVPVLVCEGTGRAADLVAVLCRQYSLICKNTNETARESQLGAFQFFLRERLATALYAGHYPEDANDRYDRCVKDLLTICDHRKMVYIYNVKQKTGLDTAILSCLMECQHLERASQLYLALRWNRVDVAQTKIFGNSALLANDFQMDLWPFFEKALIDDQPEFIRLFIEHGLDVKSSLTVGAMRDLYIKCVNEHTQLYVLLNMTSSRPRQNFLTLADIYSVVKSFSRRFNQQQYANDKGDEDSSIDLFSHPFNELFLWAVLLNRGNLALRLWEECSEPLVTAIVGTLICQSLASHARTLSDTLRLEQLALKSRFQELAITLVNKAFLSNVEKTMLLLHVGWKTWGDLNCMELAASAKDREFLASEPCQYAIWKTWRRGYEAGAFQVAVAAFTVFPVLFWIQFREEERSPSFDDMQRRGSVLSLNNIGSLKPRTKKTLASCLSRNSVISVIPEMVDGGTVSKRESIAPKHHQGKPSRFEFDDDEESVVFTGRMSLWDKYVTFYTSPSVKFTCHTAAYLTYLVLYAYVIMFSFRFHPTSTEIMLHLWTFTLICEQIRVISAYPSERFCDKIEEWWGYSSVSVWNRLDFLSLTISVLAFFLRWSAMTFNVARLLLAVNFICCLFRVFKIYFVNSYLGPKVVMLKRMAFDLAMFLLVLIIILLSYTVVSHALLHPYQTYYHGIFWDLLYHGIWVLFGEVGEELDRAKHTYCEQSNDTDIYPGDNCEVNRFPAPILLAAYCFFGNILLVNMLIATFTYVFEDVQSHSEHLWKYLMYFVTKEYRDKPLLPPPFIIIEHLIITVSRWTKFKQFKYVKHADAVWSRTISTKDHEFLNIFEKTIRSDLLEQTQKDDSKQLEKLIPEVNDKVQRVLAMLSTMQSSIAAVARPRAFAPQRSGQNTEDYDFPLIDASDGRDGGQQHQFVKLPSVESRDELDVVENF